MPTTTNNGWTIPADTDLVKNGAAAIRTLGNAIDTTLGVYSPSTAGLVLISTTAIGTAVSSVAVTNAFSTTYDNYKIVVYVNSNSAASDFNFTLGATTTGYYWAGQYYQFTGAATAFAGSNDSRYLVGRNSATSIEIQAPFLSQESSIQSLGTGIGTTDIQVLSIGYVNNTTSYTGFTLTPASGTLTGGSISVYGYKK